MTDRATIAGLTLIAASLLAKVWYFSRSNSANPAPAAPSRPLLDLEVPSLGANLGTSGFASLAGTTIGDFFNQAANMLGQSQPRGVRNNNPGNVKRGASNWRGLLPAAEQTDPVFWRFSEPEWGIRVIAYLLNVYQRRGQVTIRQMITGPGGWAPVGVDGNPDGYAEFVARRVGVTVDTPLNLATNAPALRNMVDAIIDFENGGYSYPSAVVAEGIRRAVS